MLDEGGEAIKGVGVKQDEFEALLIIALLPGAVIANPGGGVTTIISVQSGRVRYRRGRSQMYLKTAEMFAAYSEFCGRMVSSKDLKQRWPAIFDSAARPAGHSCNATMLFCALQAMGLVAAVKGKGVAGNPFFVDLSGQSPG